MRTILSTKFIAVPEDCVATVKARVVTLVGPRGTLTKSFKHQSLDIVKVSDRKIRVDCWFGGKKDICCVRTICSHIENLVVGVRQGFNYKMKFVYAHFPINGTITNEGDGIEIRNFLGEKRVRVVEMREGVKISKTAGVKDQIEIEGNSIDDVSIAASQIRGICRVRNKDIRKFLDGIYVSEKGAIPQPDL